MKKFFLPLAFFLTIIKVVSAQEVISNLSYNPALYYSTKKFQHNNHERKYLIDRGNTVVTTDTLSLPFIDDFSTNRTRSYKWLENHMTDTFYNVFGGCLANEGIAVTTQTFSMDTAWDYHFVIDSPAHFDSTAQAPIQFTFFGPATSACFSNAPQTMQFWNQYYAYSYDTATRTIDSTLVTDSTISIDYAPVVYFAQGEPGTLWFDDYAYVNNTYPVNPPTIGVATLDGLNEYGLPYDSTANSYGDADYLTSKPIDLSSFDDSSKIYLSFFYEPQGLGDFPDTDDSLMVQFKDNSGVWQTMWSDTGYSYSLYVQNKFTQVVLAIPDLAVPLTFYHNTFQFRFHNKASLFGNNDHWHIDYVRLDKNRFPTDTNIQDIAFVYPFPTILKNFTQLPLKQFNYATDLADSISLIVHNINRDANSNPPATNFVKYASELYPSPVVISSPPLQTFNARDSNSILVNPQSEYTIPVTNADSMALLSQVYINPNDARPQNDTLYHMQTFGSVVAYDDGSAERAYGLEGVGLKKFAYEFNLSHPDTLSAFQIQFAQIEDNVSDLVFNFEIWDSIGTDNLHFVADSFMIFSMENRTPYYIDSVNGFTTYKLDTPIIVPQKFYFGWVQTDPRNLQVGLDLNSTLGHPHMFYYTDLDVQWHQSTITPYGSPMIRLILDSAYWGQTSSGVKNISQDENQIQFFPNPTSGMVYLRSEKNISPLEISVMNMVGQEVKYETNVSREFDISELPSGIYLVQARDKNGKTYRGKMIKTGN